MIEHDKTPPKLVKVVEGSARMLYDEKEAVFYNKVQALNRDLSIQVIKLFSETIEGERCENYNLKKLKRGEDIESQSNKLPPPKVGISVLEALAATGLRSIRYAQEVPKIRSITLNDLSYEATEVAKDNIRFNNLAVEKFLVRNEEACQLMHFHKDHQNNFDVIDLDPYGSASPFLDAAVQAVAGDGGLLCITSTDAPVLAGNYPEVCFAKYGSMPLKADYKHEMALRILLHSIEASASRYKRYIVPWLSISVDFYVRVFVRVYESPAEVKNSYLKRIMTYQSTQCGSFINQSIGTRNKTKHEDQVVDSNGLPVILKIGADFANLKVDNEHKHYGALRVNAPNMCEESGGHWRLGGPFWGAPMHDQEVVDKVLARVVASLQNQRAEISTAKANQSSRGHAETSASTPVTLEDKLQPNEAASAVHPFPIATAERLSGILTSISEELKDVPFYYSLPGLASTLQCIEPTHPHMKAALTNAGYRVSGFHHDPKAIKTDAPNTVVWDIMRAHCRTHTSSAHYLQYHARKTQQEGGEGSSKINSNNNHVFSLAKRILSKPCVVHADFTIPAASEAAADLAKIKVNKFAPNPEAYWGPKRRAGRSPEVASHSAFPGVQNNSLTRPTGIAQRQLRKLQWQGSNLVANVRKWFRFVKFF